MIAILRAASNTSSRAACTIELAQKYAAIGLSQSVSALVMYNTVAVGSFDRRVRRHAWIDTSPRTTGFEFRGLGPRLRLV
jgi:hypothetical protein